MADARIRRQIAFLAAQTMYRRLETEYFTAKRKAAKQLGVEYRYRPGDLPSNAEIRDQIQAMARMHEGEKRLDKLRDMRIEALRLMRKLARFRPRLIGSVWTGHVRKGSDIDIHVFSDSEALVCQALDETGLSHDVEKKRIIKFGEERVFTHIHVADRFNYELTLYPEEKLNYNFKSSITGKPIEKASIAELQLALEAEDPEADLDAEVERLEDHIDRFELFRMLLQPLEGVKQSPKYHPEGDALYHSLQVFELARDERGYDEEFLLAALLHDVGKAIDPHDHVAAGLMALEGHDHRADRDPDRSPHGRPRLSPGHPRRGGRGRGCSNRRSSTTSCSSGNWIRGGASRERSSARSRRRSITSESLTRTTIDPVGPASAFHYRSRGRAGRRGGRPPRRSRWRRPVAGRVGVSAGDRERWASAVEDVAKIRRRVRRTPGAIRPRGPGPDHRGDYPRPAVACRRRRPAARPTNPAAPRPSKATDDGSGTVPRPANGLTA